MRIRTEELRKGIQAFALLFILTLLTLGAPGVVAGEQATKSGGAKPAATAAAGMPAGWKVIKDSKNKCQLAVPGDWQTVPGFSLASNAAKNSRAGVQPYDEGNWNELKQNARNILKPTKILEDGASRFFFAYGATGLHYYLARSISGVSCVAQVDFDEAGAAEKYDALAKQIIETLDKAR